MKSPRTVEDIAAAVELILKQWCKPAPPASATIQGAHIAVIVAFSLLTREDDYSGLEAAGMIVTMLERCVDELGRDEPGRDTK